MTPAKAAILNAALAPHWDQLRQWADTALADHQHSRERLTAEELVSLRRWIVVIEAMLRRLVLLSATGVEVETDFATSWSGASRAAPDAAPNAATAPETSEGATSDASAAPAQAEPGVATEQPAARKKRTFRLFSRTRSNRASADSGSQVASPTPPEAGAAQTQPTPRRRISASREPPEMSPDQFNAWADAQPAVTAADRARGAWEEMMYQSPPRKPPKTRRGSRLERKTEPELHPTGNLLERLQFVVELAANPHALIRRAAIAMARRRQLAWLASQEPAPRPRGILAGCVELYATVIPFHVVFSDLMGHFALSYTEPDTS